MSASFLTESSRRGKRKLLFTILVVNIGILPLQLKGCHVDVLSVDHAGRSVGQYFNFNKCAIHGLQNGGDMIMNARNSRTGQTGEIIVWGSKNGGSIGDSHGRFNFKPVAPNNEQWKVGDKIILSNPSHCGKCTPWELQKSNVCFGSRDDTFGTFTMTRTGHVKAIKLVHKSGYVGCYAGGDTFWGCKGSDTIIIGITHENNELIIPAGLNDGGWINIPSYTSMSKELVLDTPTENNYVIMGDEIRLWYGEDLKDYTESDNIGTSCADVFAIVDPPPPPPYEYKDDGRSYRFHDDKKTWEEAVLQCDEEGAHLAVVDNDHSQDIIKEQFGSSITWLGAQYNTTLNQWKWIDGQTIENSDFLPERNNSCLNTNEITAGMWNRSSCESQHSFLCQKGAAKPDDPLITCGKPEPGRNIRCECKINRKSYGLSVVYEVTWYKINPIDGAEMVLFNTTLRSEDKAYLENNETAKYFSIGTAVYTKVQVWYENQAEFRSLFARSNTFFIGLQFNPLLFELREGRPPALMNVTLTVPLACEDQISNCSISIYLTTTRKINFSPCYLQFQSTKHSLMSSQRVTVSTINDLVDDGRLTFSVSPRIIAHNVSKDWNDIEKIDLKVTRISTGTGRCTSTGDPHIRTFDGDYFHLYRIGYYVMVESMARSFQVHAQTHQCGTVACNCGIAAREGDDVLVIDMCQRSFSPQAFYRSNKEPEKGTFIERSSNGKTFILRFKSGAFVKYRANPWHPWHYADITIQVPPEDFEQTRGLCGTIDKDRSNDLTDRSGVRHDNCGHQACTAFTESWKISRDQSLFNYKGGEMQCLPSVEIPKEESMCSKEVHNYQGKTAVTSGYQKMVFSGQRECNEDVTEDVIITEPPVDLPPGGQILPGNDEDFIPIVPIFPTKTGTTEEEANDFCNNKISESAISKACMNSIGAEFVVTGYIEQCIADIQILDDMSVALQSAMRAMKSDCEEKVLKDPSKWETDEDGNSKPPASVIGNICPNDCSGNGICSNGTCICNDGYITDDCSLNSNAIPNLEDFPRGQLCDIRKKDCSKAKVSSLDLVPGNVVCGFDESIRIKNGGFLKKPSLKMISFSEVTCELPQQDNEATETVNSETPGRVPQTYMITLSNNGQNFSSNALPFIVYDSKCLECTNSSSGLLNDCKQKENTCLISGRCFLRGEADPKDPRCKTCDPERSTSEFVYQQDDVRSCKNYYTLNCHELYVTGFWEKDMFGGHNIEMWLNQQSCNTIESNTTHVWMTTKFTECGSIHYVSDTLITQENTATLRVTYLYHNVVERTVLYQYKLQCVFDRSVNVITANYYKPTVDLQGGEFRELAGEIFFNASMSIYTSSSYRIPANSPFPVTSFQPIYIGIKEGYQNELFKFVVTQCYATPSSRSSDAVQYLFFDKKCPIDMSFQEVSKSNNHFNFRIDAFRFIVVRRIVFIHCKLYICAVNDTSSECIQECNSRNRRSVDENAVNKINGRIRRSVESGPIQELTLTTEEITFKNIRTCNELSCPENARCLDLYPAVCRCNGDYIMNEKEKICQKKNIFEVQNLHFEETFLESYKNTSSVDFLNLARKVEDEIIALFQEEDVQIVGAKLIGAQPGSIVLHLLIMYAKDIPVEEAKEAFISQVITKTNVTELSDDKMLNKIKINVMPIITRKVIVHTTNEDSTTMLFVTVISSSVVIIALIIAIIVVKMLRQQRNKKSRKQRYVMKSVIGFDNIAADKIEHEMS